MQWTPKRGTNTPLVPLILNIQVWSEMAGSMSPEQYKTKAVLNISCVEEDILFVLFSRTWLYSKNPPSHQETDLSYDYEMRFIGYDSVQTRWFISYRFQIRTIM